MHAPKFVLYVALIFSIQKKAHMCEAYQTRIYQME